jgi:energy-coupling factor transporter transmembrane protein EcfT
MENKKENSSLHVIDSMTKIISFIGLVFIQLLTILIAVPKLLGMAVGLIIASIIPNKTGPK